MTSMQFSPEERLLIMGDKTMRITYAEACFLSLIRSRPRHIFGRQELIDELRAYFTTSSPNDYSQRLTQLAMGLGNSLNGMGAEVDLLLKHGARGYSLLPVF